MSGWQVGDLALCVKIEGQDYPPDDPSDRLCKGRIYRVTGVALNDDGVGLYLEGMTAIQTDEYHDSYGARCFRKIKPDTEPCEEEFTVLIKRGRKVSA